jgi:hypothetical protein
MSGAAFQERATPTARAHRAKVMLAAMIQGAGTSCKARIRDISRTGALVETNAAVQVGDALRIVRGAERADATVVWRRQSWLGLSFAGEIDVPAWTGFQVPARLDAGSLPDPARHSPIEEDRSPPPENLLIQRVSEELAYVQRIIDSIGEELVGSPMIVQRYAGTLQGFDRASQLLAHLGRVLAADDRVEAATQISLECLRNRLLR